MAELNTMKIKNTKKYEIFGAPKKNNFWSFKAFNSQKEVEPT
jgi:hypothetical protein